MSSLFSPDAKLMKLLGVVGDLLILNVVYLVSCLGVITVGPANTALYGVVFKLNSEHEGSLLKDYWRIFKENFKQATLIWLILVGLLLVAVVDIYAGGVYGGLFMTARPFFWLVLVLVGMCYSMAFPTLSRFENTVIGTLKNSLFLSIANLPQSALLTVLHALPVIVLLWDVTVFLKWSALFITLYHASVACVGKYLLVKIYQKTSDGRA